MVDGLTKQELLKQLFSRNRGAINPGLERIEHLCKVLGCMLTIPSIVVGGTNGKGSVSFYLHHALAANGLEVGLFTSPHLVRFNERFKINGVDINDDDLFPLLEIVLEKNEEFAVGATFFEITTAVAFLYFEKMKVDIVVLEIGLGGRWDAVNIVSPILSVITSVGIDHTEYLGNTIEKIAAEKSGVIKENTPVFIGDVSDEVYNIFKNVAISKKAPFISFLSDYTVKYSRDTYWFKYEDQQLHLHFRLIKDIPPYLVNNLALVCRVVSYLQKLKLLDIRSNDIAISFLNTWPGRHQWLTIEGQRCLLDVAHNVQGAEALHKALACSKNSHWEYAMVSFSEDKDADEFIRILSPLIDNWVFFVAQHNRAMKKEAYCKIVKNAIVCSSWKDSFNYICKHKSHESPILMTGSCYAIGEILENC